MSVDEGDSKDSHWVEDLFPPHFSFQSLVADKQSTGQSEKPGVRAAWNPAPQSYQQSSGRWFKASLHVQERDKKRKDKLVKRISTEDSVEREHHVDDSDPAPHPKERFTGGLKGDNSSCIWTNQDIDAFRKVLRSMEEDQGRLRSQLRDALVELRGQADVRRKMEALLGTEMDRQEKAVKLERDVALQKLQRELDETKAQLQKERESHTRTYTALDLLRRHFDNQSHDREQEKPLDKISHS